MKITKPTNMAVGFYITAASALLAIVSAICYGVMFSGIEYKEPLFNVTICILLAVSGVLALALLFLDKRCAGFSPAVLCICSGISFMIFIKTVIWPISDTIVGIEPFPQFNQLVICAVLILVTLIVSEVALYMKKYKVNTLAEENS